MPIPVGPIAAAVKSAFGIIDNFTISCVYRTTSSTYDVSTGVNSISATDYTIKVLIVKDSDFKVDGVSIESKDQTLLFQQSALPITPDVATDVILMGGRQYSIVDIGTDPASITYKMKVRAT